MTQPMTQHDGLSDDENDEADTETSNRIILPVPWGRLIPVADQGCIHELSPKIKTGDTNNLDVHMIGRNHTCDVVVSDNRISGYHCRIYRCVEGTRSILRRAFTVFVEDMSSNGTFVNKMKLAKHEPWVLSNGDEVALVSPKKDVSGASVFIFVDLSGKRTAQEAASLSSYALKATVPPPARSLTTAATDSRRRLEVDYSILEELGSGAIGKVYRAIERKSGKSWAVKVVSLRQVELSRSAALDDLLHEARMLRTICHPGIVSVRDVYCSESAFSLVMQLVEGGDLFDRIMQRRFYPEDDARGVLRNLLSALSYLHSRSIAHRDIKPENILLRSSQSHVDVLLSDFGLAKVAALGVGCKTFCGTPQYLAPEVMRQQVHEASTGYDGPAADIW
eukprot:CAMPEP_0197390254 /NCGR_PEP_ID=MMETSP1165-20131217/2282_1 /TAXON_ID=284809 /ORGANISM="Chrysocystis fragilis, Strain CCMP3189" /LENGTH=391 /DNA_ID=CAMNT_0042915727 /DNA_START=11 /DNA_END=1183 /DNA_ORIENTATION=+